MVFKRKQASRFTKSGHDPFYMKNVKNPKEEGKKRTFRKRHTDLAILVNDACMTRRQHMRHVLERELKGDETAADLLERIDALWETADRLVERYGLDNATSILLCGTKISDTEES
jgi:hypothetical protein